MRWVTWSAIAILFGATAVWAADASGSWRGTLSDDQGAGDSALLILQQEGTKLTGTAGSNEGDRHPIQNGKVQGDTVTFEVQGPPGGILFFELKLNGDELAGKIEQRRDGQVLRTGRLVVKRQ
jgi:hypothetical protein